MGRDCLAISATEVWWQGTWKSDEIPCLENLIIEWSLAFNCSISDKMRQTTSFQTYLQLENSASMYSRPYLYSLYNLYSLNIHFTYLHKCFFSSCFFCMLSCNGGTMRQYHGVNGSWVNPRGIICFIPNWVNKCVRLLCLCSAWYVFLRR